MNLVSIIIGLADRITQGVESPDENIDPLVEILRQSCSSPTAIYNVTDPLDDLAVRQLFFNSENDNIYLLERPVGEGAGSRINIIKDEPSGERTLYAAFDEEPYCPPDVYKESWCDIPSQSQICYSRNDRPIDLFGVTTCRKVQEVYSGLEGTLIADAFSCAAKGLAIYYSEQILKSMLGYEHLKEYSITANGVVSGYQMLTMSGVLVIDENADGTTNEVRIEDPLLGGGFWAKADESLAFFDVLWNGKPVDSYIYNIDRKLARTDLTKCKEVFSGDPLFGFYSGKAYTPILVAEEDGYIEDVKHTITGGLYLVIKPGVAPENCGKK